MARWTRIIPAIAVTLLLAACGQGTSDTPLSPASSRFDEGGGTTLGGNAVDPTLGTGQTTTSTSETEAPSDTTTKTGGTTLGGN